MVRESGLTTVTVLLLLPSNTQSACVRASRMDCFCVFHEDCIETWFKKVNHRECPVHKDN
jgi:hypothetical protein